MGLLNSFKPVRTVSADDVRQAVKTRNPGTYNLIDVRQPKEYESAHLPGARLIPLGELPARHGEIDRSLPTIVYCRSGNRSSAAAGVLVTAGFPSVDNMAGGIDSYLGHVAFGTPESGMAHFPPGSTAAELCALAWLLEDGTGKFYEALGESPQFQDGLFRMLAAAEDGHKGTLTRLYTEITGKEPGPAFPSEVIKVPEDSVMEGGVPLGAALNWAEGKRPMDIVEMMMSLETNAYDLYIRMTRAVESPQARNVFTSLSEEERTHLERLSAMLDTMLRA